jgi:predicted nucleic acid-binding protein
MVAIIDPADEAKLARFGRSAGSDKGSKDFAPDKLRNLHFDVLIALTARSNGARLVTANRSDFAMIASYRPARELDFESW